MKYLFGLLIPIFFLAVLGKNADAQVELSDSTFNTTDWTSFSLSTPSGPASLSISQVTTGGNPGSFMDVTVGAPAGETGDVSYYINAGLTSSALVYDPSTQGTITSLSFSFSLEEQSGSGSFVSFYFEQNGIYYTLPLTYFYVADIGLNGTTSWQTYSGTVSDFSLTNLAEDHVALIGYDASGAETTTPPDVSSTGSPIEFGIGVDEQTDNPANTFGLDNFDVTINPAPEPPAALLMLATGALGLLVRRRLIRRVA